MTLLNYLGFSRAAPAKPSQPNSVRALPASWYTSYDMFRLEQRAVFGRRWMMITHKSRLPKANDQLDFEVAEYEFTIRRDQKDNFVGFTKSFNEGNRQNGRSGPEGMTSRPIHVHLDQAGFIWVNLDQNEVPEVPWTEDFNKIDMQERYNIYNFDDYVLDHEYRSNGPYNWKILADNFNECYHCPTAHPTIDSLADIETHDVETDCGWIKHQSVPTEEQQQLGMAIASTYFFPNVSISVL